MAKIPEKNNKKELFIYFGNNMTTSDGLILQKNYILEKSIVEKIKDKKARERIVCLSDYVKNKEVR